MHTIHTHTHKVLGVTVVTVVKEMRVGLVRQSQGGKVRGCGELMYDSIVVGSCTTGYQEGGNKLAISFT